MRRKIILSLFVLFLFFTVGIVFTTLYITNTTETLSRLISLHQIELLREGLVINIQTVQSDLYTVHTPLGRHLDSIVKHVEKLDAAAAGCSGCHHKPELKRRIEEVQGLIKDYKDALSYYITASANAEMVEKLKMDAAHIGNTLLGLTQEMTFTASKKLQEMTAGALIKIKNAQGILFGTLILAFFLALWVSVRLTKAVTKPIGELVNSARMIASGHLGYKMLYEDKTEFGELARNFNSMSERLKEEQEQLIQSAKLAAIGELASNVAHEINNPLTSIIGFTELLKDERDVGAIRSRLEIIEKESMRAREIVRELLHFARKRPLQLTALDVNQTLKDVIPLIESQAKMSRVELQEEYAELPQTMGDTNQLKQVFINIINNAISAMPEGGRLKMSTSRQGEFILARFSDTGHGIPEEIRQRIFEPFYTTKKDKGTGLGLSISYRIIQQHGGRIDVESMEGNGSTFTVRLPIKSPA